MAEAGGYDGENLTERQKSWFATIRANLEKETGRSMEDWVAIARTCPENTMRARVTWMKTHHGLGQNRGSIIMSQAFPAEMGWDDPSRLRDALWKDPASRAIFEAVEAAVGGFEGLVAGQRKGFSAWSRNFQFAAIRPLKGGKARLGLAVPPDAAPGLEPARNEGWSERLKTAVTLSSPSDVDDRMIDLLKSAAAAS
ncbi:MAG: DUF4287 domain-containing protein [Caulobacter sp.]|nr:DUF4287 domain-containing protein [Caulobacter sp.]